MENQQDERADPPQEEQDISSKTVFVLVLLTLAVSFIGAWVSVASVTDIDGVQPSTVATDAAAGQMSFTIAGRNEDESTGKVAFEIVDETG